LRKKTSEQQDIIKKRKENSCKLVFYDAEQETKKDEIFDHHQKGNACCTKNYVFGSQKGTFLPTIRNGLL
jgi:hypothetical protein